VNVPAVELQPRLVAAPPGIGVVAPFDLALDRELWRWTPEPVSLYLTRTAHLDVPVSLGMAQALGDVDALMAACREVSIAGPAVTAYLCTSASFVGGLEGEAQLRAAMERGGAQRALTTSGAMLEALAALGARTVAVATPYDAALTDRLVAFLAEAGIATTGVGYLGMEADIWRVDAGSVRELAHAIPRQGADAIFLSCTNLPTYDVIPALEAELDIPVLSANLVTLWAALRELGALPSGRPERLFEARSPRSRAAGSERLSDPSTAP
jgi:maleate isomerase